MTRPAPARPINWPAFWRGFTDGLSLCATLLFIAALIAGLAAWQLVFPTIGLLWVVGWLA